jgi:non-specific protein-tyrosine kinase
MLKEDTVELRWVFQVVRRWLWLIVGCTLLGAISAFLVTSRMSPTYSASVTLLVQAAGAGSDDYRDILASELMASTYSMMLTSRPVLEEVIARLELQETLDVLVERIEVKSIEGTPLVRLSVKHNDPIQSALIANAIAEVFIARIRALQDERYADSLTSMEEQIAGLSVLIDETRSSIDELPTPSIAQEQTELARLETILAGYRNTYATLQQNYQQMRLTAAQSTHNVIIAESAVVPRMPVSRIKLYMVIAATVGGAIAVGTAFLLEYLDDTIKTPDDISRTLGLPTLGTIGRLARGEDELIVTARPLSPVAEAYRILRTNIRFSSVDEPVRTLLVTSPSTSEGKSFTLANLAVVSAQADPGVTVVDADMRRPRLHELFKLNPRGEGLTKALVEGSANGRLQSSHVDGLRILPSGQTPPNPAELVGSQRMQGLLNELAQEADIVLVDCPPVLPVADAVVLARTVDGVLLVIYAGKTRREAARQAVESLRQVGASLIGVVLNAVPAHRTGYYHYRVPENGSTRYRHRLRRWKELVRTRWRIYWRRPGVN